MPTRHNIAYYPIDSALCLQTLLGGAAATPSKYREDFSNTSMNVIHPPEQLSPATWPGCATAQNDEFE